MVTTTGQKAVIVFIIFICGLFFFSGAHLSFAQTRQHGTHVHGVSVLNMALTDKGVYLELESPAMNMLGFEHAPRDAQQEAAVHDVEEQLKNAEALFTLASEAKCRVVEVQVEHKVLTEERENHEVHGEHNDHAHHKHDRGHSEFHGLYQFECAQPEKIQALEVQLFSLFPGLEKLEVQLLTPGGQTARELTQQDNQISW